jgi:hypothetical protein
MKTEKEFLKKILEDSKNSNGLLDGVESIHDIKRILDGEIDSKKSKSE